MILKLRRITELMNKVCGTQLDADNFPEEYRLTEEEQIECFVDEGNGEDIVEE